MNRKIMWAILVIFLALNIILMAAEKRPDTTPDMPPVGSISQPDPVPDSTDEVPPALTDPVPAYTVAETGIYSQPTSGSDLISTLAAHTDVELIDSADGWSRLMMNGEICYASADSILAKRESNGFIVAIDAGHQQIGNLDKEPLGPGSNTMKYKVSYGTSGKASGLAEYELTLMVSLKLQTELENRGYQVVMIRTTHDVDISNAERAAVANEAGADAFIRIHADGSEDPSVHGASALYQSADNRYNGELHEESKALATYVLDEMCASAGCQNNGARQHDAMSGINWCKVPVTLLEMGYMTNTEEDLRLASEDYQYKIVSGIANGVDRFLLGDSAEQ